MNSMPNFYDEGQNFTFHDRASVLNYLRLTAQCRSAAGWMIVERFDDRFDTEVGGFQHIVTQSINPDVQFAGGVEIAKTNDYPVVQAPSVIVDYHDNGKIISMEEAANRPELAAVLTRLRERQDSYAEHLAARDLRNCGHKFPLAGTSNGL